LGLFSTITGTLKQENIQIGTGIVSNDSFCLLVPVYVGQLHRHCPLDKVKVADPGFLELLNPDLFSEYGSLDPDTGAGKIKIQTFSKIFRHIFSS
jgi:hypothetical protein